jgi:hypothetical protein
VRESFMQSIQAQDLEEKNRLRVVFDHRVITFGLGTGVTFGEVARTLNELAHKHYGDPVGIDVMLASRRPVNGVQSKQSRTVLPYQNGGSKDVIRALPRRRIGDTTSARGFSGTTLKVC